MSSLSIPLRARLAQFVVVGILLIPVGMSSLRGLTHLLTCRQEVATPFTVEVRPGTEPVIATSATLSRQDRGGLCGGLAVDMRARKVERDRVAMIVYVRNSTPSLWVGTVQLQLQDRGRTLYLPLDVGRVPATSTRSSMVPVQLTGGTSSFSGALLIGP